MILSPLTSPTRSTVASYFLSRRFQTKPLPPPSPPGSLALGSSVTGRRTSQILQTNKIVIGFSYCFLRNWFRLILVRAFLFVPPLCFLFSLFFSVWFGALLCFGLSNSRRTRRPGRMTISKVPAAKCTRNPCLLPLLAWPFLKPPSKSTSRPPSRPLHASVSFSNFSARSFFHFCRMNRQSLDVCATPRHLYFFHAILISEWQENPGKALSRNRQFYKKKRVYRMFLSLHFIFFFSQSPRM